MKINPQENRWYWIAIQNNCDVFGSIIPQTSYMLPILSYFYLQAKVIYAPIIPPIVYYISEIDLSDLLDFIENEISGSPLINLWNLAVGLPWFFRNSQIRRELDVPDTIAFKENKANVSRATYFGLGRPILNQRLFKI